MNSRLGLAGLRLGLGFRLGFHLRRLGGLVSLRGPAELVEGDVGVDVQGDETLSVFLAAAGQLDHRTPGLQNPLAEIHQRLAVVVDALEDFQVLPNATVAILGFGLVVGLRFPVDEVLPGGQAFGILRVGPALDFPQLVNENAEGMALVGTQFEQGFQREPVLHLVVRVGLDLGIHRERGFAVRNALPKILDIDIVQTIGLGTLRAHNFLLSRECIAFR